LGIERDVVLGYMWLNLAAAQGLFEAKDQLDWVVDFMDRARGAAAGAGVEADEIAPCSTLG
jgi:hypothetical protein